MAGYQYAHMEVYSRKILVKKNESGSLKQGTKKKWNTSQIFAEAKRDPDACHHVENPKEPILVYGQSLDDTEREHDRRCDEAVSVLKNGKTRKLRDTQNTLVTIVLSHPSDVYGKDVEQWEKLSVLWLRKQYGDQLKTVIRHDDEGHQHLHAYVIPDDLKAVNLHPGEAKKMEAKQKDLGENGCNRAYKEGLREWQDSYHSFVGLRCGLARTGPKRERLSREEWVKRQVSYDDYADTLSNHERYKEKLKREVAQEWAKTSTVGKLSFARSTATKADIEKRAEKKSEKEREKYLGQFSNLEKAHLKEFSGRKRAEQENDVLSVEVHKLGAEVRDKEHLIAKTEYLISAHIHDLDDRAKETGLESDYHALSGACRAVGEVRKADKRLFKGVWSEVRGIIQDVQKRAPEMIKTAFSWVLAKKEPAPSPVAPAPVHSPRVEPAVSRVPSPAPSFNM